jgi:hypothetical protein
MAITAGKSFALDGLAAVRALFDGDIECGASFEKAGDLPPRKDKWQQQQCAQFFQRN